MIKVTIHAAKTNLSKLIARVEAGEEVLICRGDKEVARLTPIGARGVREEQTVWDDSAAKSSKQPRKPGLLKGKVVIPDTFYDPWSAKDFSPGIMDSDPEWGEPGVWDGKTPRKPGALRGEITLDESFFDPLSDEELGLASNVEPKP
ncbi:MAG: type II toxin-antitoxin system Phd/YefM family antitoxin [Caulobacterales bacterium]|nr:type II toxin-antitoxin system Phd/YefM family antitoxin [Caulobacterales bacterium]